MAKQSAGILVYRFKDQQLEVLLAHNGGPFFKNKDAGWWSIPKGLIEDGEQPLETAKREFKEELGIDPPNGSYVELGSVRQSNNKDVHAWAVEGDLDASSIKSNKFETEWPPKSGKIQKFPEIDRAEWFKIPQARIKANKAQVLLLDRLLTKIN